MNNVNSDDEDLSQNRKDKMNPPEALSRRYQRGIGYLRKNRVDPAKIEFKKLLRINSDDASARFGLGCVYAFQGLRDKAVGEWNRCIEVEPGFAEAHYALAWAYYDAGDAEKAYEHVKLAWNTGVPLDPVKDLIDGFVRTIKPVHFGEEKELTHATGSLNNDVERAFEIEGEEREYELLDDPRDLYQYNIYYRVSNQVRDISYLAVIFCFGLFLCLGFLNHEYLLTGYPDWIYHAYRIKSLLSYGFLNWSNDWAGGFPLWQSYQFIPHMISAGLTILTGWSVTRSMIALTAFLFILLRLLIYITSRVVGFSPEAGLISSFLSFTLIGYYGPLKEFSLLWGVTLFPMMVLGAKMLKPGNGSMYVYSLVVGACFYIHPILAVVSGLILGHRCLLNLGWPYGELLVSIVLFALGSSFYWFPILFGDKPVFMDPWVFSTKFLRTQMPHPLLGLSLSLIATGLVVAYSFLHREIDYWTGFLSFGIIMLLIIVLLSYVGILPGFFILTMPTRWMPFIGLLLALLGAPLIDWGKQFKLTHILLLLLLLAIAYEGHSIAQMAMPKGVDVLNSPEAVWVLSYPSEIDHSDKILNVDVPWLSYFAFGKVRTTLHYYIQGSYDLLSSPLNWLVFSSESSAPLRQGNFSLIERYLKATGTTHIMVFDPHPMVDALLPGGIFEGELTLLHHGNGLAVFRVPWEPCQAFHNRLENRESLSFPDIAYDDYDEHRLRDNLVTTFDEVMYGPDSIIVPVYYPTQTEISVDLKDVELGRYLLILAVYDGSWQASVNGEQVPIERNGPNYIGIDISRSTGDLIVNLIHRMHWTWKMGMALMILGYVIGLVAFFYTRHRRLM